MSARSGVSEARLVRLVKKHQAGLWRKPFEDHGDRYPTAKEIEKALTER